MRVTSIISGRDSAVNVTTGWDLEYSGTELRRGGGEDFPQPYDWLWGSPSLLHNGYRVSFTRVKRPSRGVEYPRPSRAEVKERVEVCLYFRLWAFVKFCKANLTF